MLEVPPRGVEPRPVLSVDMRRMNKVLSIVILLTLSLHHY